MGFPCGSAGKESSCNARELGSIPGLGRSPGEGKGYPLQYSGLENSIYCIFHSVTKSRTRPSDLRCKGVGSCEVGQGEVGVGCKPFMFGICNHLSYNGENFCFHLAF